MLESWGLQSIQEFDGFTVCLESHQMDDYDFYGYSVRERRFSFEFYDQSFGVDEGGSPPFSLRSCQIDMLQFSWEIISSKCNPKNFLEMVHRWG